MTWLPTKPGFYWAKWLIASPNTREGDLLTPSDQWEVVEVFPNLGDFDSEEPLLVSVLGVERAQSIGNFIWGEGPLPEPAA